MVINLSSTEHEIMGGIPVFSGTRVPIHYLFEYLDSGTTVDDFLEDFESVKKEQVIQLLVVSEKLTIS